MVQHKSKLMIAILVSVLLCQQVASQILAIDFGTQYIKAAIVHSGAGKSFQIVQNHKSQRKFYNAIGFYNDERFYQTTALSKRSKLPTNCFIYSRLLVDFMKNPDTLRTIKKELLLEYINAEELDQLTAKFLLKGFSSETDEVTFMDIFAMILKHVKMETEKFAKTTIKDVVITVPSHWDLKMREFLVSAAEVADMYVLSLIAENTAASINYALNQRKGNQTQTVMFYNLGANALQMSLVEYRAVNHEKSPKPIQSLFVIGDYGKSYVGGLRFDQVIATYFAQRFEEKYKKELNLRAHLKLIGQAAKVKETLSANKQASIFVEGIMDGIDYSDKINREKFQQLAAPILKQLTSPIKRFLLDNNMKPSDIKTVELIGGSVRMPKLQSLIGEIIGKQAEIGTHINGDQAMALGSAFYAANSSKKFKVKGIHLYDGFNFEVRLVIRNLDENISEDSEHFFLKNVTVFKPKSRFGTNKEVTFKCKENIIVEIFKQDDKGQELLRRVEFGKIADVNESDFKVSFTLSIDPVHIVTIKDSKILYKREEVTTYLEKVKKQKKQSKQPDNVQQKQVQVEIQQETDQKVQNETLKTEEQTQNVNQQQQVQSEDTKAEQVQDAEGKQEEQNNETIQEDRKEKEKEKKKKQVEKQQYQTVEKTKNVTKKYEKQLSRKDTFNYQQRDADVKAASRKLMKVYQDIEQNWRKLLESKNKLEAAIYEGRDKLQNAQFLQYTQTGQKELLQKQIGQEQTWIEETVSNEINDYKEHYENIHKIVAKIKKRMIQFYERDQVKARALEQINQYKNLTEKIQKDKPWITDQKIQELKDLIQTNTKRIEEMYGETTGKAKNQDLPYRNRDFLKSAEIVKDMYFVIKATPKPKQEKKKDKEKEKEKEKEDDSNQEF